MSMWLDGPVPPTTYLCICERCNSDYVVLARTYSPSYDKLCDKCSRAKHRKSAATIAARHTNDPVPKRYTGQVSGPIDALCLVLTDAMQGAADAALETHNRATFRAWHTRTAHADGLHPNALTDGIMRARMVAYLTSEVTSSHRPIDDVRMAEIMDNLPIEQVDNLVEAWT